jgi:outer membrane lipoprotein-sorting protein
MSSRARPIFIAIFLSGLLAARNALAVPPDQLKSVLDRLNAAAAKFESASANVEFDTVETDPVPDTDVQTGVVYYERKSGSVRMGVHLNQHNGKPSAKEYTFIGGTFKLFEPGVNQETTYAKAGKWESYVILGMGASGKDLQAKWDITDLGPETVDGAKTEKLELIAKDADVRKNISKVTIWVDPDRAVSFKQEFILSATSSYVCHYSNFKFNSSLPSEAFTFKTNGQTVYRTQQ